MRQGSEVRWILLACAVLNCLGILLSAGEYRGMVSDGIYDFLASTGSDPNIQLESLRGYQSVAASWTRRGNLFLGFLWGNRAVTRVPVWRFLPWARCGSVRPVVSRAGGTDPRVVPGYGRISGMHLLSVVEIPQKRQEQSDFLSKI